MKSPYLVPIPATAFSNNLSNRCLTEKQNVLTDDPPFTVFEQQMYFSRRNQKTENTKNATNKIKPERIMLLKVLRKSHLN